MIINDLPTSWSSIINLNSRITIETYDYKQIKNLVSQNRWPKKSFLIEGIIYKYTPVLNIFKCEILQSLKKDQKNQLNSLAKLVD